MSIEQYPTAIGGPVGHHILLPVASPERSTRALPVARKLALDLRSVVTLLTVRRPPEGPLLLGDDPDDRFSVTGATVMFQSLQFRPRRIVPVDQLAHRLVEQVQSTLRPLLWQIRSWGVEARALVQLGEPAEEIVRTAGEVGADLIVMAEPRGRRWRRLRAESPAVGVRRLSPVPVLDVPL